MRRHAALTSAASITVGPSIATGAALALVIVAGLLLLLPASNAWGAGTVNLTVNGTGSGKVTSSSNGTAAPGEVDCSYNGSAQSGACAASYTGGEFGFLVGVILTASPSPGSYLVGWTQSGASAAVRCTTPPQSDPTCKVDLNEFSPPGPTATVTATFAPLPDPPVAVTGTSSEINSYLTELGGTVNPNNFAVSTCRFEYGTTTAYGTSVPCSPKASELGALSTPVAVSGETEPLNPNTTYHYRLVASNLGGGAVGEDRTFVTGSAPADPCPNAARRAEQGIAALLLPDCMALEMVSPPEKNGQPAKTPSLSADGGRATFFSTAPLGGTTGVLSPGGDPYIASRSDSGWVTQSTVPPPQYPRGWGQFARAESFTPDLSCWFQVASTSPQYEAGIGQAFGNCLEADFSPLSPLLMLPGASGSPAVMDVTRLAAVSADHSHLYFAAGVAGATYLPGDPVPAGTPADRNVYLAGLDSNEEPSLQLLARDSGGKAWGGRCGARMGGNKKVNGEITRNQGAVSADGSRTYFTTRAAQPQEGFCTDKSKLRILLRTETPSGPEVKELIANECTRVAPACSAADGDDRFQGASVDSSKVYFTTTRQLANSDLDATNDLYLWDGGEDENERLTQVSAGGSGDATPGAGANVQGNVAALSTDGSHVYFVATDVLTTAANPVGATATAGQPNLYLWEADSGETSFLGTLVAADSTGLWGDLGTFQNQAYPVPATAQDEAGNEVGGDGHVLAFQSKASLTSNDADAGRRDVFRHDAGEGTLECVSCKPGGADAGAFDVFVNGGGSDGTDYAERGRWASEDGSSITFTTAQPLLPGDSNGVPDVFLWREGGLYRLPGSAFRIGEGEGAQQPALSHDGSSIAFHTGTALLPSDGDNAPDVYVARVGGGFAFPIPPAPCQIDESLPGDRCQTATDPPARTEPGSAAQTAGNVVPRAKCRKGFVRKGAKCAKKPVRKCRKGFVRKGAKCVKKRGKQASRSHADKGRAAKTRQTDGDRRAAK